MIPRFSPNYDTSALLQCLLPAPSNAIKALEQAFCERTGHNNAIAFKYGRSGLYTLLRAMNAEKKIVIMPSYTCVVVAHAVVLSGNIPYFLDNTHNQFQPVPEAYLSALEALETQQPGQVAMVIPTHLFGIAEETQHLYQQIKQHYPHVFVLQDCAHSYFAQDSTGNCVTTWGDGALFGMNISKLVNSVRGGMLTLKEEALVERIRKLQATEWKKGNALFNTLKSRLYAMAAGFAFTPAGYEFVYWLMHHTKILSSQTEYFQPDSIDLPSDFLTPMLPFEASMGALSLRQYGQRIEHRRQLAQQYINILSAINPTLPPDNRVLFPPFQAGNTWSHFPVCVPPEKRDTLRAELEAKLRAEIGIIVDYSVADLPAYQARGAIPTPVAAQMAACVINLPMGLFENRLGFKVHFQQVQQLFAIIEVVFKKNLSVSHVCAAKPAKGLTMAL